MISPSLLVYEDAGGGGTGVDLVVGGALALVVIRLLRTLREEDDSV